MNFFEFPAWVTQTLGEKPKAAVTPMPVLTFAEIEAEKPLVSRETPKRKGWPKGKSRKVANANPK